MVAGQADKGERLQEEQARLKDAVRNPDMAVRMPDMAVRMAAIKACCGLQTNSPSTSFNFHIVQAWKM